MRDRPRATVRTGLRPAPRRAYEDIAHELLVVILSGRFGPGDRLPSERQLASQFGVSRPTVREALSALEARGLVETRVGSGTFVVDDTVPEAGETLAGDDSPAELMEARLAVEVAAARLAAKRASASGDGLELVRASVEALERTADRERLPDELDCAFHRAIADLTGNAYLIALVAPIWETMTQDLFTTLRGRGWSAADSARVATEHRAVYEALRAGDAELAAFAMERHLRAEAAKLFADEDVDGPPPRFFA